MDTNRKDQFRRFFLYIGKEVVGDKTHTTIRASNRGVPFPEVILIVEHWLEGAREDFKKTLEGK